MTSIHTLKRKQKAFYKSIVSVFCPLLNETIYFTSDGFLHLLYESNRRPRNINEQFMKLKCLNHVPLVLQKSTFIVDTRTVQLKIKGRLKLAIRHALVYEISSGVKVRVIVERIGSGKFKFLSVMPNSNRSKRGLKTKKHP